MVVEVAMQSAHTRVVAIKPTVPIIGSLIKQPWRKFAEAFFVARVARLWEVVPESLNSVEPSYGFRLV